MKFGLDNITALCAALDNPERAFQSVIVGGTNGKGSVTAMTSAALHAAGHRVARYTSPHLERLEERFVIDEREVTTPDLRDAAAAVQRAAEALVREGTLSAPPTFFECATAIAFELFRAPVRSHRRPGSRAWRPPRRHQRRVAHRGGHHVDRLRSSGAARRQPGVDRCGKGRHHQAGDPGHLRAAAARGRSRHGGDLPRAAVHALVRALDRVGRVPSRRRPDHRQPSFAIASNPRRSGSRYPVGIRPRMLPSSCACWKSFRRRVSRFLSDAIVAGLTTSVARAAGTPDVAGRGRAAGRRAQPGRRTRAGVLPQ